MNSSFQFQMPEGVGAFVNNHLGLLLILFAIGAVIAFSSKAREALWSLRLLRQTLASMFNRSPPGR